MATAASAAKRKAAQWNPTHHPRDARGRFTKSATRVMKGTDGPRAAAAAKGFKPVNAGAAGVAGGKETLTRLATKQKAADQAMKDYLAGGWKATNPKLRTEKNAAADPAVVALDKSFTPLAEDLLVERRVPLKMFAHIPVDQLQGMKVRDAAPSAGILDGSAGDAPDGMVTMHVATPAGTPVYIDPDSGAIVSARDTEVAISKAVPNGRGGWDMYGVVIPRKGAEKPTNGRDGDGAGSAATPPGGPASDAPELPDDGTTPDVAGADAASGTGPRARATGGQTARARGDKTTDDQGDQGAGSAGDTDGTTRDPKTVADLQANDYVQIGNNTGYASQPTKGTGNNLTVVLSQWPDREGRGEVLTVSPDTEVQKVDHPTGKPVLWKDRDTGRPARSAGQVNITRGQVVRDPEREAAVTAKVAALRDGTPTVDKPAGDKPARKPVESKTPNLDKLSPVEQATVRTAVADEGPGIFQSPMVGGNLGDVGRYVSEGRALQGIRDKHGADVAWGAAEEHARANPGVLARSRAELADHQADRLIEASGHARQAAEHTREGRYDDALASIDAGELTHPAHRENFRGWDEMRALVDKVKTRRADSDAKTAANAEKLAAPFRKDDGPSVPPVERPNPRDDPKGYAGALTDDELAATAAKRGLLPTVRKAVRAEQERRAAASTAGTPTPDAPPAPAATGAPVRESWRDHGKPAEGMYYGRKSKPDAEGRPVTIEQRGMGITIRDKETGKTLEGAGITAKLWLAPNTGDDQAGTPGGTPQARAAAAGSDLGELLNSGMGRGDLPTSLGDILDANGLEGNETPELAALVEKISGPEGQIRSALERLLKRDGRPLAGDEFVDMSRLRKELPANLDRATVDEALRKLGRTDGFIVPESNQKTLTAERRAAAVNIGDQDKHLVALSRSDRDQIADDARKLADTADQPATRTPDAPGTPDAGVDQGDQSVPDTSAPAVPEELAGFDQADQARIRIAAEDKAGEYAGSPLIGKSAGDVARYVSEGSLKDLVARTDRNQVQAAVKRLLTDDPSLMDRTPDRIKADQAARKARSTQVDTEAVRLIDAGDLDGALAAIDRAEQDDPDFRISGDNGPGVFGWDDLRDQARAYAESKGVRSAGGDDTGTPGAPDVSSLGDDLDSPPPLHARAAQLEQVPETTPRGARQKAMAALRDAIRHNGGVVPEEQRDSIPDGLIDDQGRVTANGKYAAQSYTTRDPANRGRIRDATAALNAYEPPIEPGSPAAAAAAAAGSNVDAVRGTYKGAGRPETFLFHGFGERPKPQGVPVRAEVVNGQRLELTNTETGKKVGEWGVATRFWSSPMPGNTEPPKAADFSAEAVRPERTRLRAGQADDLIPLVDGTPPTESFLFFGDGTRAKPMGVPFRVKSVQPPRPNGRGGSITIEGTEPDSPLLMRLDMGDRAWIARMPGAEPDQPAPTTTAGSAAPKTGDDALQAAPIGLNRDGTSDTQRAALSVYQDGGNGVTFQQINAALRGDGGKDGDAVRDVVAGVDSAMAASPLTSDVEVFRGERRGEGAFTADRLAGDLTGLQWVDDAYVSTGPTVEDAKPFAGTKDKAVLMRLHVPAGTGAVDMSDPADQSEVELLLDRGHEFRVTADRGVVNGVRQVDVEVLPKATGPARKPWEPNADGTFNPDGTPADQGAQTGDLPDRKQLDAMMHALAVGEGVTPPNKRIRKSMADKGWVDDTGRLTPDGYAAARRAAPERYHGNTVENPDQGRIPGGPVPLRAPGSIQARDPGEGAHPGERGSVLPVGAPDMADPDTWQPYQWRGNWYVKAGQDERGRLAVTGPWKTKREAQDTIESVKASRAAAKTEDAKIATMFDRVEPKDLKPGDVYLYGNNLTDRPHDRAVPRRVTRVVDLNNGAAMVYDDSGPDGREEHLLHVGTTSAFRYKNKPVLLDADDDGNATGIARDFRDADEIDAAGGRLPEAQEQALLRHPTVTKRADWKNAPENTIVTFDPILSTPKVHETTKINGRDVAIVQYRTVTQKRRDDKPELGYTDHYYAIPAGAEFRPLALAFNDDGDAAYARQGTGQGYAVGEVEGRFSYNAIGGGNTAADALKAAQTQLDKRDMEAKYGPIAQANVASHSKADFDQLDPNAEIQPGDLVVLRSFNKLRTGVATKVTRTRVEALVSTPSGQADHWGASGTKGVGVRLLKSRTSTPDAPAAPREDARGAAQRAARAQLDGDYAGALAAIDDGERLDPNARDIPGGSWDAMRASARDGQGNAGARVAGDVDRPAPAAVPAGDENSAVSGRVFAGQQIGGVAPDDTRFRMRVARVGRRQLDVHDQDGTKLGSVAEQPNGRWAVTGADGTPRGTEGSFAQAHTNLRQQPVTPDAGAPDTAAAAVPQIDRLVSGVITSQHPKLANRLSKLPAPARKGAPENATAMALGGIDEQGIVTEHRGRVVGRVAPGVDQPAPGTAGWVQIETSLTDADGNPRTVAIWQPADGDTAGRKSYISGMINAANASFGLDQNRAPVNYNDRPDFDRNAAPAAPAYRNAAPVGRTKGKDDAAEKYAVLRAGGASEPEYNALEYATAGRDPALARQMFDERMGAAGNGASPTAGTSAPAREPRTSITQGADPFALVASGGGRQDDDPFAAMLDRQPRTVSPAETMGGTRPGSTEVDIFGNETAFEPASRSTLGMGDRADVGRERGMKAVQQLGMFDVSDQKQMEGQSALLDGLMQMPASEPPVSHPLLEPDAPEGTAVDVPEDLSGWTDEQLSGLFADVSAQDEYDEIGTGRIVAEWDRREREMASLLAKVPDDLGTLDHDKVADLFAELTSHHGTMDTDQVKRLEAELDARDAAHQAQLADLDEKKALLERHPSSYTEADLHKALDAAGALDDEDALYRVMGEFDRREAVERADAAEAAEQARQQIEAAAAVEAERADTESRRVAAEQATRQADKTLTGLLAARAAGFYGGVSNGDAQTAAQHLDAAELGDILQGTPLDEATLAQKVRLLYAAGNKTGPEEFKGWSDDKVFDLVKARTILGTRSGVDPEQARRASIEWSRRKLVLRREVDEGMLARDAYKLLRSDDLTTLTDDQLASAPAIMATYDGPFTDEIPIRIKAVDDEIKRRIDVAQDKADRLEKGPAGPAKVLNPAGELARIERFAGSPQSHSSWGMQGREAGERFEASRRIVLGLPEGADTKTVNAAWKQDPRPLADRAALQLAWYRHLGEIAGVDTTGRGSHDWMSGPADVDGLPDVPDPLPPANIAKPADVWKAMKTAAEDDMAKDDYAAAIRVTMAMNRAYGIRLDRPAGNTRNDLMSIQGQHYDAREGDRSTESQKAARFVAEMRRLAEADGVDPDDTARYGPADKGSQKRVRFGSTWVTTNPAAEARAAALIAQGVDTAEAYAQVYGLNVADLRRAEAENALLSGSGKKTIAAAYREAYDRHVADAYSAAEAGTNGHLLNEEGTKLSVAGKLSAIELFSGASAKAYKYASEDLKRWWGEHPPPRLTFAEYKETIAGDGAAARGAALQKQKGNEFA